MIDESPTQVESGESAPASSEHPDSSASTQEATRDAPHQDKSGQTPASPPFDQTPTHPTPEQTEALANSLAEDRDLGKIRSQLVDEWKQAHGESIWQTGENQHQLKNDYLDWRDGPATQWAGGNQPDTLESRTEAKFREQFPDKARAYDALERVKVYPDIHQDPAFHALEQEITRQTNNDSDVQQSLRQLTQDYTNQWERANKRITLQQYTRFIKEYPEKAKGYAAKDPYIARLLELQAGSTTTAPSTERQFLSAPPATQSEQSPTLSIPEAVNPPTAQQAASEKSALMAFQAVAAEIDPTRENSWKNATGEFFFLSGKEVQIAVAETTDPIDSAEPQFGLLVSAKDASTQQSLSVNIPKEFSAPIKSQLFRIMKEVLPKLHPAGQYDFIRLLARAKITFANSDEVEVTQALCVLALGLKVDHAQSNESIAIPAIKDATLTQPGQLKKILELVRKKMPGYLFEQKIAQLDHELKRIPDAFGTNFPQTLTQIMMWAFSAK